MHKESKNLGDDVGGEERSGHVGEGHDCNRIEKQQVISAIIFQREGHHKQHDNEDGNVGLDHVRDHIGEPVCWQADAGDHLHVLELHLALLDYEGDDDARDQGQCNRCDDAEVEGLSVLHARLEDGQLRERRSDSLELLSIGYCCNDRLVGVLREVRY